MSTEQHSPAVNLFDQLRQQFPEHQWILEVLENAAALTGILDAARADLAGAAFHRSAIVSRARKIIEVIERARRAEAGVVVRAADNILEFARKP